MRIVRGRRCERVVAELEQRRSLNAVRVDPVVRRIVLAVRQRGDAALRGYMAKLDGISSHQQLRISDGEIREAWEATPGPIRDALKTAAKNIRAFAQRQMPKEWHSSPVPGLRTGQILRPIAAVGCYVPSGRHALPSTLLMTVIPAQVAGVDRIAVASPNPARETLAAASLLGVTEFYRMGGAHAIATFAYGTESVARVDKIVGPGNVYVTAAKKLVSFDCAIDMLAGPTEIVIASEKGEPALVAVELIAQAEHDPDALAVLVTTRAALAESVAGEVVGQAKTNKVAKQSLTKHGYILVAATLDEAREFTNRLAPEHLTVDDFSDLAWVRNAGSVFVGSLSAQAMGDYVSGPNHTLPTGALAKVRGGLSVMDYLKLITVQEYSLPALLGLGPAAIALAEAEGLIGHADAIRARGVEGHV